MKKIFTFLSMAAFAGSAMAVMPTVDMSQLNITPEARQALNARIAQEQQMMAKGQLPEGAYTRSWTDQSGTTWRVTLSTSHERWADGLEYADGTHPTWEDMPFYLALYYLQGVPQGQSNYTYSVVVPLSWPTNYYWKQLIEEARTGQATPEDEIDWSAVDPAEMATEYGDYCSTFTYFGSGYVGGNLNSDQTNWATWVICDPAWVGSESMIVWNNTGCALSENSVFTFTGYDDEEFTYEIENKFVMAESSNPSRTHTLQNNFNGTIRELGFNPKTYTFNVGEVHIFDLGLQGTEIIEDKGEWDDYDYEWGPLHKYYAYVLDRNLSLVLDPSATTFDKSALGFDWSENADPNANLDDVLNTMGGALYSPADCEGPAGAWTMHMPTEVEDPLTGRPTLEIWPIADCLIPWGYNESMFPWTETDGFELIWHRYYSFIGEGTTLTNGIDGFRFKATDNYENTYKAEYEGKYYFHNNPANIHEYVELSTGNFNGVNEVKFGDNSNAPVEYYNLQGIRVANPTDGQLYIVRQGNESKKIIKK